MNSNLKLAWSTSLAYKGLHFTSGTPRNQSSNQKPIAPKTNSLWLKNFSISPWGLKACMGKLKWCLLPPWRIPNLPKNHPSQGPRAHYEPLRTLQNERLTSMQNPRFQTSRCFAKQGCAPPKAYFRGAVQGLFHITLKNLIFGPTTQAGGQLFATPTSGNSASQLYIYIYIYIYREREIH